MKVFEHSNNMNPSLFRGREHVKGCISPLRYPGGKTRVASVILNLVPKEEKVQGEGNVE
jgi:hypothetical protein